MSIRGIDTQIMVNRSSELSKDASAMQKRPELHQEALASQQKIAAAQSQARVSATSESEMENIRTDVDGGGSGAAGGEGGGSESEEEKNGEIPKGMLVPPSNNLIDIKV